MVFDRRILEVLFTITEISNNRKLGFQDKLNKILHEIVGCMQVKRGSIMLLKNRMTLEVVASTSPDIIGTVQRLEVDFPSSWVVKNKKPLYVDSSSQCASLVRHFKHYKSSAFYLVPIISSDRVIGVVNVTDKIGSDKFNQDEREILLNIMGNVIIALENNRLAESLKKKQKTLKKKNLELRKLQKLRTDLFNMLVHDLKGPISDIIANLDILTYTVKGENTEYVETAQAGCNTLYNMVSNLLDIARLEEGNISLLEEELDPQELIKESIAGLLVTGKSKNLSFQEQFPEAGSVLLHGDRSMLTRVLQNLLANAIHYSPRGATITTGFRDINSQEIEFSVNDSGPGVPEQYKEAIFDKYVQLDKKADGRVYTTGLGLAFCKMAVEAHGGAISVESGGDKGSKFCFVLPLGKK